MARVLGGSGWVGYEVLLLGSNTRCCSQELFAAVISQWRKDHMRSTLKGVKKALDDSDKARKAGIVRKVICLGDSGHYMCVVLSPGHW